MPNDNKLDAGFRIQRHPWCVHDGDCSGGSFLNPIRNQQGSNTHFISGKQPMTEAAYPTRCRIRGVTALSWSRICGNEPGLTNFYMSLVTSGPTVGLLVGQAFTQ